MRSVRARLPLATPLMLAAAGAVLSACGPTVPLDTSLAQADTNIQLGGHRPVAPTPPPMVLPALNPVPNFPSLSVPPPPLAVVIPTPAPTPAPFCPTANALAAPAEVAPATPASPPAASTYVFRYSGTQTYNPGTAQQRVVQMPALGYRRVAGVSHPASDGSYTFTVEEVYDLYDVATTFLVRPNGPASSLVSGQQQGAGLYLQEIVRQQVGRAGTDDFAPQPAVLLMPFPAQPGVQYQAAGTSPLDQTELVIPPQGGNVKGDARVDACGTVLDAVEADVKGQWVEARTNATKQFDLDFSLGTQYGGVILSSHYVEQGTDDSTGEPYTLDLTSTIDSTPKHAAAS